MKRPLIPACALVILGAAACTDETPSGVEVDPQLAFGAAGAVYEVTIENLTAFQPFTPPVVATHRPATAMFRVGHTASEGVRQIAENGNLDPMLAALAADRHVSEFTVALGPVVPPLRGGEAVTARIRTDRGASRLSFVSMLICTNDGFTGLASAALPAHLGASVTHYTAGYDAGSELNTESFDDLVPPCGPMTGIDSMGRGTGASDASLAEGGVIAHHTGITGAADLVPSVHGWSDPVARITITRVE
jgi:hypothetical protein